jgi:hypothetical protein
MIKNYAWIAALAISVTLTGCTKSKTIKIEVSPIQRQQLNLPSPDQVMQDPIYWMALARKAPAGSKGSIEHFWQELEKSGASAAVALSPAEFRKLKNNNARLRKFILQQKSIIRAYKKYYAENK